MLLQSVQKPILRSVVNPGLMGANLPLEEMIEDHKIIEECRGNPEQIMQKAGDIDTFGWEYVAQEVKQQSTSRRPVSMDATVGATFQKALRAKTYGYDRIMEEDEEENEEEKFEPVSLSFTQISNSQEGFSPSKIQVKVTEEKSQENFDDQEDFKRNDEFVN